MEASIQLKSLQFPMFAMRHTHFSTVKTNSCLSILSYILRWKSCSIWTLCMYVCMWQNQSWVWCDMWPYQQWGVHFYLIFILKYIGIVMRSQTDWSAFEQLCDCLEKNELHSHTIESAYGWGDYHLCEGQSVNRVTVTACCAALTSMSAAQQFAVVKAVYWK